MQPSIDTTIGFIGAGQMATALARGLVRTQSTTAEYLIAADPLAEARDRFAQVTGATVTDDNAKVFQRADVVFLCVKPQQCDVVLARLPKAIAAETLVVSVMAGVPLARLAQGLGGTTRLVRVMPNTPCLVGAGACAYCLGATATEEDGRLVGQILQASGMAIQIEEKYLDAVTGLSGSGPAYVYQMIEALRDGGVQMGLPQQVAATLAAQTVLGAAQMVVETRAPPSVLIDQVTSPGGTTMAGLAALDRAGFRSVVIAAVEAATRRSRELGAVRDANG